jgi:phage terminase large subunit
MSEPRRISLPHNWHPREYQIPTWRYFIGQEERKRAVCVWHRRAGKDLMAINMLATKAIQKVGTYWHLFPEFKQARAAIWNGITSEGKRYLDHFPKEIIERTYENEMRVKFVNGSNYYLVGSDNYDGLMGTNPCGIVLSEYSLQDPAAWQYLSPILAENRGWALFIYTFRGRNHGWALAQQAKANNWFYDERYAGSGAGATKRPDGTPVVSDEEIEKLRKEGISEAVIQSEYFNNCEAPLEGAYYAKQMADAKADGRIGNVLFDPKFPVNTAWDIGHDMTVVIFFQVIFQEIRIIDLLYKGEQGLPYFVGAVKAKPYDVYGEHYAPWDIDTREWATGKSRMDVARELGIRFSVKPQKPGNQGIHDGIEQVKLILPRCIFNEQRCGMLIEGLRSFRAEEEQGKMQYTGDSRDAMKVFKDKPLHDWASHFDSAMRVLAWNVKNKDRVQRESRPSSYLEEAEVGMYA